MIFAVRCRFPGSRRWRGLRGCSLKRFTETNKWRDPWYRKLSGPAKLLWQYLLDNCDNAGVIELDIEAATFFIGEPINEQHVRELESRLKPIQNGKLLIPKFVRFQFGELKPTSVIHRSIITLLRSHAVPIAEVSNAVNGMPMGSQSHQEKDKVQEQEKEKEPGSELKLGEPDYELVGTLLEELGFTIYNRAEGEKPSHIEEEAALAVIKRPNWKSEKEQIMAFGRICRPEDRRFEMPKTLFRLLENWSESLDKARNYKPHETRKPNPRNVGIARGPTDYGEVAKRKLERQALEAKNRVASEAQGTRA